MKKISEFLSENFQFFCCEVFNIFRNDVEIERTYCQLYSLIQTCYLHKLVHYVNTPIQIY